MATARTAETRRLASPTIQALIQQRSAELIGLVLGLLGLALLVALACYDPRDPSLNTATSRHISNLAGPVGAVLADLLLQGFGVAGALPGLAMLAWAWRIASRRGLGSMAARLAAMLAALPVLAAVLAAMPAPPDLRLADGGRTGWRDRQVAGVDRPVGRPRRSGAGGRGDDLDDRAGARRHADAAGVGPLGERVARRRSHCRRHRTSVAAAVAACRALGAVSLCRAGCVSARPPAPSSGDDPVAATRLVPAMDEPPPVVSRTTRPAAQPRRPRQESLPLPEAGWRFPPLSLLKPAPARATSGPSEEALQANARLLESVLADYGVQGSIVEIRPGPVVTLYELEPAPGIRSARVIGLADDVARSLSVTAVRIATVPGRNVIGIEVPNAKRETVFLSEILSSRSCRSTPGRLTLALGKDISGAPIFADLARMPHLMIAGTTGSGKSVGVNAMILSLLYRLSPDQCRLILIDPKMLELSMYEGIPHLMAPVVTEPAKAVTALKWTVREMERRYRAMSQLGVRNIGGYNDRVAEARAKGEVVTRRVQTGFDPDTGRPTFEEQPLALEPLPLIVVVVDEMADLMMVAGKEIEAAVQRLAQMARAAGIHVIMATQRPSVDVITGTIKANFPTRISFQVISKFDSRTILGEQGAEQLLGMGDMLFMQGGGRITRVHGPFVSDEEVEKVVEFLREQGEPAYLDEVTEPADDDGAAMLPGLGSAGDGEKGLYDQAVAVVAREGKASTSFIQRHLNIGYNRAAKLIEQMEKEGIVGPANHVGKREVLVRRMVDED